MNLCGQRGWGAVILFPPADLYLFHLPTVGPVQGARPGLSLPSQLADKSVGMGW